MKAVSLSTNIYIGLIVLLATLGAINAYLPQGSWMQSLPQQEIPYSKLTLALISAGSMLFIYGGLGFLGLQLARKLGFPEIWDAEVSLGQRLVIPALIGVGTGVFFIVADTLFKTMHTAGALPHPPFPTSLVASATAGIGEEVIFRLFFIPLWMWLISTVILGGRWESGVFGVVAVLSALAFGVAHLPSVMALMGLEQISEIPGVLIVEILLLNGVLSLLAAYYFRRYGFLAAVSIHFWTDVIWHVIWGVVARN